MKIEILEFVDGARNARGITVVIDVFRAFSSACYAYDSGAVRVIAASSIDASFILRRSYRNSVLAGERNEKKIEGFDFGNSPTEIIETDLQGRTVILTTTAGTNGLINAEKADIILTGSLVNASAVVKYIRNINPEHVSLVAMGYRGSISADEDLLCAEMIKAGLTGKKINFDDQIKDLRFGSGARFFKPENLEYSPPTDFFLCTMKDRFNFVLRGEKREDGNINLAKIEL